MKSPHPDSSATVSAESTSLRAVAEGLRDIRDDLNGMTAELVDTGGDGAGREDTGRGRGGQPQSGLDPSPLPEHRSFLVRWLGPLLSVAILIAVINELRTIDIALVRAVIPTSLAFWCVYLLAYCATPAADWLIFRRLWGLPVSGFPPLLRKQVCNEMLLSYVGELSFFTWVRARWRRPGSPFGAIKDVAILSALVGNVVTLAMVCVAWPMMGQLHLVWDNGLVFGSIGFILLVSIVVLYFSDRVFSLSPRQLRLVSSIHFVRMVATVFLAALAWAIALPGIAFVWWFVLSTVRQVVARLPFLPNKDLVFAGMTVFLIGSPDSRISAFMAFWGGLVVLTHVVVGLALVAQDCVEAVVARTSRPPSR